MNTLQMIRYRSAAAMALVAVLAAMTSGCYKLVFGKQKWADPILIYSPHVSDHAVAVHDLGQVELALAESGAPVSVGADGQPGSVVNTGERSFQFRTSGTEVMLHDINPDCEHSQDDPLEVRIVHCEVPVISDSGLVYDWLSAVVERPEHIGLRRDGYRELLESGEVNMNVAAVTSVEYDSHTSGTTTYTSRSAQWLEMSLASPGENVTVIAMRKPRRWIGWLGFAPTAGLTAVTITSVQRENYGLAVATGIPAFALGWWSSIQAFRNANPITVYERGVEVYP